MCFISSKSLQNYMSRISISSLHKTFRKYNNIRQNYNVETSKIRARRAQPPLTTLHKNGERGFIHIFYGIVCDYFE